MGLRKTGDSEPIEPLEENEADVLQEHIAKTGKRIEELDDEERQELWTDLDNLKEE